MVDNEIRADEATAAVVDVSARRLDTSYALSFKDQHLASAAGAALTRASWTMNDTDTGAGFFITDDVASRGTHIVLVVDDAPGSCQVAVQALMQQEVAAVASRFELDRLPVILSAALGNVAAVPVRVVRSSAKLPLLDERQRKVLELLATGISNTVIAGRLHVSQATVKREVSELLQIFDASNRLELAMRGAEAGLVEINGEAHRIARRSPATESTVDLDEASTDVDVDAPSDPA